VMAEAGAIPQQVKDLEVRLGDIQARLQELMLNVRTCRMPRLPAGAGAEDNVEVRRWATPRDFDFAPRDHVDVGAALGLDFEVAAKIAGFAVRRAEGPRSRACTGRWRSSCSTRRPSSMAIRVLHALHRQQRTRWLGTGQLPKFRDDMFWVTKGGGEDKEELYLISTSEISLTTPCAAICCANRTCRSS